MSALPETRAAASPIEARSGLDPWVRAELPAPPMPRGIAWLGVVGPGIIVLGVSIGSGEFLLGPAAFVRYGLSLLWVTLVAIVLQTVFNLELMRYTLATGEPVFSGFMRTRPSSTMWAWIYAGLYFLQVGWPAWAANAAGAIFFLIAGRLASPEDATTIYAIGVAAFLVCFVILCVGRRIEQTLEVLNWVLVVSMLGGFLVLAALFVPAGTWLAGAAGLIGFDAAGEKFTFIPPGVDFFLLGALVGYSGCGGAVNLALSNWARDKGYGMAERAGYIPSAIGGQKAHLVHSGFTFDEGPEPMKRWRGWWRIVRVDQWVVFCLGAILGMVLPALLYVAFLPRGSNIEGVNIGAALASATAGRAGGLVAGVIAFLGAWVLFKTQLDNLEGMVRAITDILWTGSHRVREWRGGDVRGVYYSVLVGVVIWGMIALRLAQPIVLLKLGANVAGFIFIVASLHLLYINTRLLPLHVRPPMWRRLTLVAMAIFYGFFVVLSVGSAL